MLEPHQPTLLKILNLHFVYIFTHLRITHIPSNCQLVLPEPSFCLYIFTHLGLSIFTNMFIQFPFVLTWSLIFFINTNYHTSRNLYFQEYFQKFVHPISICFYLKPASQSWSNACSKNAWLRKYLEAKYQNITITININININNNININIKISLTMPK